MLQASSSIFYCKKNAAFSNATDYNYASV